MFTYAKVSRAQSRQSLHRLDTAVRAALTSTGFGIVARDPDVDEDADDDLWMGAYRDIRFPALPVRHDWSVWMDRDGGCTDIQLTQRLAATTGTWAWAGLLCGGMVLGFLAEFVWPGLIWLSMLPLLWGLGTVTVLQMQQARFEKQFWATLGETTPLERGGDGWIQE